MIIRQETNNDIAAISEVTSEAFKHIEISNQTEHFIIHALCSANVLAISLVAEINNEIVSHVAFSPVTIEDNTTKTGTVIWYRSHLNCN